MDGETSVNLDSHIPQNSPRIALLLRLLTAFCTSFSALGAGKSAAFRSVGELHVTQATALQLVACSIRCFCARTQAAEPYRTRGTARLPHALVSIY